MIGRHSNREPSLLCGIYNSIQPESKLSLVSGLEKKNDSRALLTHAPQTMIQSG